MVMQPTITDTTSYSKISVLVVDGNYQALRELGSPVRALQEVRVQLEQACWDVKQSTLGIFVPVNFFWPNSTFDTVQQ